ncbi:hypothetical protein UlMin_037627 [Ulmus minor]
MLFFTFKIEIITLLSIGLVLMGAILLICYAYRDFSCTLEVQKAILVLKKAYGDSMRKVLHVDPDYAQLFPYCIVCVADIKLALPYRAKSFSLLVISDALDYLSLKYLNKTLPKFTRVFIDDLVIFAGYLGKQRAKLPELSKFGCPAKMQSSSWWIQENDVATKKFEVAATKKPYRPSCQVFHLKSC